MKNKRALTLTALLLAPLAALHAAEERSSQSYGQLVQKRLREGLDFIANDPVMASRKPTGQEIWKALLLLHENKNIENRTATKIFTIELLLLLFSRTNLTLALSGCQSRKRSATRRGSDLSPTDADA